MLPVLIIVFSVLLGACGGSSTSASDKTSPAGASSTSSVSSIAISVEPAGNSASAVLSRKDGGTLRVVLPDGDTATFEVPAEALETDTLVSLVPLRTSDGVGVDIQPNGLWLDHAARLTFGRSDRSILVRSTPAQKADRFTVIGAARPSTPIVRFRPVLVVATIPEGLVPPAPGAEGSQGYQSAPGVYAFPNDPRPDGPDPIDDLAENVEREAESGSADDPGASRSSAVRKAAAVTADQLATNCDDKTSGSASRIADTMQTAGATATSSTKPKCVKRVIQLVAQFDVEGSSSGANFSEHSVVAGHGTFTALETPTTLTFTLGGEQEGVAEAMSYGTSGIVAAFGQSMGVEAPPMNGGSCQQSEFQNGVVTGTASIGSDSMIELQLQPQGTYTFTCTNWFQPMSLEATVLTALQGLEVPFPITTSIPDGRNVVRVLGQIMQSAEAMAASTPDGRITYSNSGLTMSISLSIGVFWSRADRCNLTAEEKAKGPDYEQQACGAGPA